MKKRILSMLLVLTMLLTLIPVSAAATTTEAPKQDAENYYILNTAADLAWFAEQVNGGNTALNARMAQDITCGPNQARLGTDSHPYAGTFDGNGHTLTVAIAPKTKAYAGGLIDHAATCTVKNLTVDGTLIASAKNSGGVIGIVEDKDTYVATLENCISKVDLSAGELLTKDDSLAGLVGMADGYADVVIRNCGYTGTITGKENCAGLVGWAQSECTVENSFFSGTIKTGEKDYSGQYGSRTLVRIKNTSKLTMTNCYYCQDIYGAQGTLATADQLASGKLCWLLNGEKAEGVWKQNLGAANADPTPVLDATHAAVHKLADGAFVNPHAITVTGGTANVAEAVKGTEITLTAGAAPEGQKFKNWSVTAGSVALTDANAAITTFTMPDEAVTVEAVFVKKLPDVSLTMKNGDKLLISEQGYSLNSRAFIPFSTLTLSGNANGDTPVKIINKGTEPLTVDLKLNNFQLKAKEYATALVFTDAKAPITLNLTASGENLIQAGKDGSWEPLCYQHSLAGEVQEIIVNLTVLENSTFTANTAGSAVHFHSDGTDNGKAPENAHSPITFNMVNDTVVRGGSTTVENTIPAIFCNKKDSTPVSLTVTAGVPTKTSYKPDEIFDPTGLKLTAVHNGYTEVITQDYAAHGIRVEYSSGDCLQKNDTSVRLYLEGDTELKHAVTVNGLTVDGKASGQSLTASAVHAYSVKMAKEFDLPAFLKKALPNTGKITDSRIASVTDEKKILQGTPSVNGKNIVKYDLKDSLTKDDIGKTAVITIAFNCENYLESTVQLTVEVHDKFDAEFTGFADSTITYGETYTPAAKVFDKTDGITYSYQGKDYGPTAAAPKNAGAYTVTATYDTPSHHAEKSVTLTIEPKVLNASDLEYTGAALTKVYDGDNTCALTQVGVKAASLVSGDAALTVTGTAQYNSESVDATNVSFTPATVSNDNYELASGIKLVLPATITAKALTINSVTVKPRAYAPDHQLIEVTDVTFNEDGVVPALGSGITAKGVLKENLAGTRGVTVTVTLGSSNYTLAKNTIETTVELAQAAYGSKTDISSAMYGNTGTLNVGKHLCTGAVIGTPVVKSGSALLSGKPAMEGSVLSYTFLDVAANTGKTAVISIPVSSVNYESYTIEVTVTVLPKPAQPNFKLDQEAVTAVYGDDGFTLAASGQEAGSTVTYSSSNEAVATVDASTGKVTIVGAGSANIVATATATDAYAVTSVTCALTVTPAPVTITVGKLEAETGDELPVLKDQYTVTGLLNGDQLLKAPKLTYVKTPDMTEAGEYTIQAAGADAGTNYAIQYVPGTLVITWYHAPHHSDHESSYRPFYPVEENNPKHGAIQVEPSNAKEGETVTITVRPGKGYELEKLLVTDRDGGKLRVHQSGNKFTFVMPGSKAYVDASFVKAGEKTEPRFVDVSADAYYAAAVDWAVEHGITGGIDAEHFAPDQGCTRAQMVTFLWRAAGSPKAENRTTTLTDVSPDDYYYEAVLWAVENGITAGVTADRFAPNATCTRAQTVTFLHRAASKPAANGTAGFADVNAGAYYADAVNWAVESNITSGTTASTFAPNATCTRAQIVTFLYRTYIV